MYMSDLGGVFHMNHSKSWYESAQIDWQSLQKFYVHNVVLLRNWGGRSWLLFEKMIFELVSNQQSSHEVDSNWPFQYTFVSNQIGSVLNTI
jgi:hypothetical protein